MVTTVSTQLIYVSTEKKKKLKKKQNDQKCGLSEFAEIALGIKINIFSSPDGEFKKNAIALKCPNTEYIAIPARNE